jgi:flagellar biosynthesis/type III secretory pathway protein FliH
MSSGTADAASPAPSSAEIEALQKQVEQLQKALEEKTAEQEESKKATGGEEGGSGGKSETKMLKMKAQMTSRIKALEKELDQLKQVRELSGQRWQRS